MNSLKTLLKEKGYKKLSVINPLILQSDVLLVVKKWLTSKHLKTCYEESLVCYEIATINFFIDECLRELEK